MFGPDKPSDRAKSISAGEGFQFSAMRAPSLGNSSAGLPRGLAFVVGLGLDAGGSLRRSLMTGLLASVRFASTDESLLDDSLLRRIYSVG